MKVRAGISGWRYPPWRRNFYPQDVTQDHELAYASRQLRTIELNGSFYSLQSPKSYKTWYETTPGDFVFAVKGGRYITHTRRLKNCEAPLGSFFASGILHLREKLGPILWQLPPTFLYRAEVLEDFFKILPRDFRQAAKLAQKSDRLEPDVPRPLPKQKIQHVLEVRHPSFENPEFIELLRKHDISLVFADTAGKWPYMEDVTGEVIYLRLHGDQELYVSGYSKASIAFWAKRIRAWSNNERPTPDFTLGEAPAKKRERPVYVYFDNDEKIHAPFDAQALQKYFS